MSSLQRKALNMSGSRRLRALGPSTGQYTQQTYSAGAWFESPSLAPPAACLALPDIFTGSSRRALGSELRAQGGKGKWFRA